MRQTFLLLLTTILLGLPFSAEAQERMMFGDTTRVGVPYSKDPHVIKFKGRYLMYYSIPPRQWNDMEGWNIGIAESKDLVHWERIGEITPKKGLEYEKKGLCAPCALVIDNKVHLFYQTYGNREKDAICHAVSKDGLNFKRDKTNPIFRPEPADWTCGRAIDAEVVEFKGKYFLYYATRDPKFEVQKLGVAVAEKGKGFGRKAWREACTKSILFPVLPWEGKCIEAPSCHINADTLYMFYAGGYNNEPQQIGWAWSTDGINFERSRPDPYIDNGKEGEWNSSESGHPHLFADTDGRTYLFYQGNNNGGKTWQITQEEINWRFVRGHWYLDSAPSTKERIRKERESGLMVFEDYEESPRIKIGKYWYPMIVSNHDDIKNFVQQNLQWPEKYLYDDIKLTVTVYIDVDVEGNPVGYRVEKPTIPAFDEEAIRIAKLIKTMRGYQQYRTEWYPINVEFARDKVGPQEKKTDNKASEAQD